jgi:RNA polymerase sigma-70 factor (ECF subfamily)
MAASFEGLFPHPVGVCDAASDVGISPYSEQSYMVGRKSSEGMMECTTVGGDKDREEHDILIRLQAGDRSRLGKLIDRYGEGLMRYLVMILGKRESAEDMFQDTWVKVMERIQRYDPDRPFAPWLFRIARNSAYDHLRRNKRWRQDDPEDLNVSEVHPSPEIDSTLAATDLATKLLSALSPKLRELIYLRFYADLSYQEIADRCRIPIGTVKSGLRRGLDNLARAHQELEAN